MDLRVDRHSDVPLHEQIAAQLVFLIASRQLKAGTLLPSVRALAMRLGVHRNTIVRAYHHSTLNLLVEKRAGTRLVVLASDSDTSPDARDLDALLGAAIAEARRRGYSLREVHDRLLSRLRVAPPDRLLLVEPEAGMRALLSSELARLRCPVEACSLEDIRSGPHRALGAVVVSPPAWVREIRSLVGAGHAVTAIAYSPGTQAFEAIAELRLPSQIALISVSAYLLGMARAVLAPAVGRRHALRSLLVTGRKLDVPRAADIVVCDTLTYPVVRARTRTAAVFAYRLLADSCLDQIREAIAGAPTKSRPAARGG